MGDAENKTFQTVAEELSVEILSSVGVRVADDVFQSMEQWLGVENDDGIDYEGPTLLQTVVPETTYEVVGRLLTTTYQGLPLLGQPHRSVLEASSLPSRELSLYLLEPIRIMRWVRHWMDTLPLTKSDADEFDDSQRFTSRLLQFSLNAHTLVDAVFDHIQNLSFIQSQIHSFSQSLQGASGGSDRSLNDPQKRMEVFKTARLVEQRFEKEWSEHVDRLEVLLASVYRLGNPAVRVACRRGLGRVWSRYTADSTRGGLRQENTSASGMPMTLRLLHRILLGAEFKDKVEPNIALLRHHLLPLHKPSALVLWRDQTSILDVYHKPLVTCIAVILQKAAPQLWEETLKYLVHHDIFPTTGSTNKQVLLLHELDTLVKLPQPASGSRRIPIEVYKVLARCISSENAQIAERALQCFQSDIWVQAMLSDFPTTGPILLPSIVRREPSWNPTVRKMSFHVLEFFCKADKDTFEQMCNSVFASEGIRTSDASNSAPTLPTTGASVSVSSAKLGTNARSKPRATMSPPAFRLPKAVGMPRPIEKGSTPWSKSSGKPPPLTVTGVAPWANISSKTSGKLSRPSDSASPITNAPSKNSKVETGIEYVLKYMKSVKPTEEETGSSSWSVAQMAETPTLLSELRFHDLVFGHELGQGAFGVVKYARLIDKTKTRSLWPEYAVKIISTEKIREIGYESSLQREIAILRMVSHPGIARLVSNFRFREGAYLVLEYASKGDLFTLLRKKGSLDEASVKFVMGEVLAALVSLHDMSFVYADLKPENILITEVGHIKLTDFGGCRPVTDKATNMVKEMGKNVLRDMRDGDWKPRVQSVETAWGQNDATELSTSDGGLGEDSRDECEDRIEGTTAYLPPEVVMGARPSLASDMWAFGCVLYQCLSGRPPILENDDTATRNRIVSFDASSNQHGEGIGLFENDHDRDTSPDARKLILSLLNRNVSCRPGVHQVATESSFFQGVDVWSLHRRAAHPLGAGQVAASEGGEDPRWARRQFSSIWAPQPIAYDVCIDSSAVTNIIHSEHGDALSGPIPEGAEGGSYYAVVASSGPQRRSGLGNGTDTIFEGRAPLPSKRIKP